MKKIYKFKKCGAILNPKEIDVDLDFQKGIKKISNKEGITEIPIVGTHKNCGGEIIIIKN